MNRNMIRLMHNNDDTLDIMLWVLHRPGCRLPGLIGNDGIGYGYLTYNDGWYLTNHGKKALNKTKARG